MLEVEIKGLRELSRDSSIYSLGKRCIKPYFCGPFDFKVGQTLYVVDTMIANHVFEEIITGDMLLNTGGYLAFKTIRINKDGINEEVTRSFTSFGGVLFFTKEEADARLKDLMSKDIEIREKIAEHKARGGAL
ncbi:hypothetical protein D3C81_10500 [compost metagenome]